MMRSPLLILAASTALAGCSLAPKYVRPELPTPVSWPVGDAYLRQSEAALPAFTYRDVFRDPRLQQIIVQALANNRDLRVAAANIAATVDLPMPMEPSPSPTTVSAAKPRMRPPFTTLVTRFTLIIFSRRPSLRSSPPWPFWSGLAMSCP